MALSEAQIQQQCVVWFRNNYCRKGMNPRYCMFSVANEAAYSNKQYISTGVLPGVSDTIVILPGKVLFIEFKTATGRQSDRQKEFEEIVTNLEYEYFICRSLKDFQDIICVYENSL